MTSKDEVNDDQEIGVLHLDICFGLGYFSQHQYWEYQVKYVIDSDPIKSQLLPYKQRGGWKTVWVQTSEHIHCRSFDLMKAWFL